MGYKTFDKTEENYQAEVEHLNNIARYVTHSDHGDFLKHTALSWLKADKSNKRILWAAWKAIVTKYRLAEEVED